MLAPPGHFPPHLPPATLVHCQAMQRTVWKFRAHQVRPLPEALDGSAWEGQSLVSRAAVTWRADPEVSSLHHVVCSSKTKPPAPPVQVPHVPSSELWLMPFPRPRMSSHILPLTFPKACSIYFLPCLVVIFHFHSSTYSVQSLGLAL